MELTPIDFRSACNFIEQYHRHHKAPIGHKFSIGAIKDGNIVGVVIVGRPIARGNDDGYTLEVTRCCSDGTKNVCSFLYSAAWRAAKNLGYRRLITYILKSESGTSLRASGYKELYSIKGRSWNCLSRPRIDKHPVVDKTLFEISINQEVKN